MTTGNGSNDPRVASLEEARKRKAEQEKAAKRAAGGAPGAALTFGQRAFGVAMIVMAAGFLFWLVGGVADGPAQIEVKP